MAETRAIMLLLLPPFASNNFLDESMLICHYDRSFVYPWNSAYQWTNIHLGIKIVPVKWTPSFCTTLKRDIFTMNSLLIYNFWCLLMVMIKDSPSAWRMTSSKSIWSGLIPNIYWKVSEGRYQARSSFQKDHLNVIHPGLFFARFVSINLSLSKKNYLFFDPIYCWI